MFGIMNKNAGKGDKRRPFNYKKFCTNYDDISWKNWKDWGNVRCCNCNISITNKQLENHPQSYTIHSDGSVECKNCNFN